MASNKSKLRKNLPNLRAKNEKQGDLIRSILTNELTIVKGPAGTGKTYVPAVLACELYEQGKINKIVLSRPNAPSGKSLGYFPGSLEEKMEPWVKPFLSVMASRLQQGVIDTGLKNGNIEIVPFETMRGRSFDGCFVFLDEAQNTTSHEMEMFLTRLGQESTTVINGDITQSDMTDAHNSGLVTAIRLASKYKIPNISIIEFDEDDIVRSGMCQEWVKAFGKERKAAEKRKKSVEEDTDDLPDWINPNRKPRKYPNPYDQYEKTPWWLRPDIRFEGPTCAENSISNTYGEKEVDKDE